MKKYLSLLLLTTFLLNLGASKKIDKPLIAEVMQSLSDDDWRELDPEKTLYLKLNSGLVIIELSSLFAPEHVSNIQKLAKEHYWDGLAIVRSQDNYVVQWGDPDSDNNKRRLIKTAKMALPAEFEQKVPNRWSWTPLESTDAYASKVGFVEGFPVGKSSKRFWMLHCYGAVGVSRDVDINSGNGSSLYIVIGHAPRHLDRNITLVGKVVYGMEHLSTLPRGFGPLGFYEKPSQHIKITSIRLASEIPKEKRMNLEILKTNSKAFRQLLEARKNRQEEWFYRPAGNLDICNAPVPVRVKEKSSKKR